MTPTTSWPDPNRPGVPMFPERRGWHILDRNTWEWCPTLQAWNDAVLHPSFVKAINMAWREYHGPCLTPTQIAEMLAGERERCGNVCKTLIACEENHYGIGLKTTLAEERIKALTEARKLIRKLGPAS